MYDYILFDLDGTLTDPKQGITGCVQYALRRLGMEETDADKLEPFIGPPSGSCVQQTHRVCNKDSGTFWDTILF